MENQNTNQPNPAGFDFNNIPKANLIKGGIGLFGAIMVLLPWVSVKMGFLGTYSVNGFNSIWGVLVFIVFLGVLVVNILGEQILKLKAELVDKINMIGGIAAVAVLVIDFIRIVTVGHGATVGIGLILALVAGVALLLFGLKVIKI